MRLPSKTTPYERSVMSYFPSIAAVLADKDTAPTELYEAIDVSGKNIGDYLDALDCLFAIGRLALTEGGLLRYVG